MITSLTKERWRPSFDTTINFGHIGVIISVLFSGAGVYFSMAHSIEESEIFRIKYSTIVDSMVTVDKLHDERMLNNSAAIHQINEAMTNLSKTIKELETDIAVVKTLVSGERKEERHLFR